MNIMAFIPARGGSKGIPNKNLALLNGIPLIQYTIDAAKKSRYVTDIFVSSDNQEIIDFAKSLDIKISYIRPAHFASDDASMADTLMDALHWLKQNREQLPDSILLLQPTSPLRNEKHIDEAIEMFIEKRADSLVSAHTVIEHPYECIKLGHPGWKFLEKPISPAAIRQNYKESFYFINGAIYIVNTEFFLREKRFIVEGETAIYLMSPHFGVDINDVDDLRRAEFYIIRMKKSDIDNI